MLAIFFWTILSSFTNLAFSMQLFQGYGMRFIKHIIGIVLLLLSSAVWATGNGPYAGIQVGQTNLNNVAYDVNTGLPTGVCNPATGAGCIISLTDPNNTGIGERLFFGIQMNKYAGFEIGVANYAPSVYSPDVEGDSNEPTIRVYALDIVGKGMYSLYNFTLFGKIGAAGTRETASSALVGAPEQVLSGLTSAHVIAAVGLSFDINANWVVDISASKIFQGSNFPAADFYGIGLSYHWVDLYCGQFLC